MHRTRTHKKVVSCRQKQSPRDNSAYSEEYLSKAATCNISVIFSTLSVETRRAVEVIYGVFKGEN